MKAKHLVEVRNVHRRYRLGETEVHAVRGVSFALERGEFAALVGASGSGKSTLLNMVGCIDAPDEGDVILGGRNTAHLSETALSRLRNESLGFVFQTFNLMPVLNVYENVELPLLIHSAIPARERHERVLRAIDDVGLSAFLAHKPDKLSGGQRQRVSIARALVTSPLLILADEPTANLDSETAHRIIDLMLDLNRSRQVTFLFSTHDEKLIAKVNRRFHIQDGQLQ